MGVTMTVANMLSLIALSWMTAQLPAMARSVAAKEWAQLDNIFWRSCLVSCAAFVAGAGLFVVMRWYLESTPYGVRFLPPEDTVGLLFAMGFYHLSGLFAAYLRSHLQEPFLWPSLIGALLTAIAAVWVAPLWGAQGIVIVLLVINGLFFFPVALWMWIHYRHKWHAVGN
jgi:O-antigen/teichoic acid export membrane protein